MLPALLGEAVAAVDRPVLAGLERHLGGLATADAGRVVHPAGATVAASASVASGGDRPVEGSLAAHTARTRSANHRPQVESGLYGPQLFGPAGPLRCAPGLGGCQRGLGEAPATCTTAARWPGSPRSLRRSPPGCRPGKIAGDSLPRRRSGDAGAGPVRVEVTASISALPSLL